MPNPLAQAGVERGERLVEEDDIGSGGEGAGERDPLHLTAGELLGPRLRPTLEPDEFEDLGNPLLDSRLPAQSEGDISVDIQVREQGALLRDDPDPAAFRRNP